MKQTINIEVLKSRNLEQQNPTLEIVELCAILEQIKPHGNHKMKLTSARMTVPKMLIGQIARLMGIEQEITETETHSEYAIWVTAGETEWELYCVVPRK